MCFLAHPKFAEFLRFIVPVIGFVVITLVRRELIIGVFQISLGYHWDIMRVSLDITGVHKVSLGFIGGITGVKRHTHHYKLYMVHVLADPALIYIMKHAFWHLYLHAQISLHSLVNSFVPSFILAQVIYIIDLINKLKEFLSASKQIIFIQVRIY